MIRHLGDKAASEEDLILVEKQTGRFKGINVKLGELAHVYHPSYTIWDDLRFPASSTKPGSTSPTWVDIGAPYAGLYVLEFSHSPANQYVFVDAQMPHDWLEGSALHAHVHWLNHEPTGAGGDIVWTMDCAIAGIGDVLNEFVSTSVAMTVPATQFTHNLVEIGEIDMTGETLSSMIVIRLTRTADAAGDTYGDGIGLLEFDLHYERDGLGSREEYVK